MAQVELRMPKMGESIIEATILKWLKDEGDPIEMDESILEIATDKVDSDLPSPVAGILAKKLFKENDIVEVGQVIALIATDGEDLTAPHEQNEKTSPLPNDKESTPEIFVEHTFIESVTHNIDDDLEKQLRPSQSEKFYSPLVRNMSGQENVTKDELDSIQGSGLQGRVTKNDLIQYIEDRKQEGSKSPAQKEKHQAGKLESHSRQSSIVEGANEEIIEMSRMRQLIADHMVKSIQTSPHVTSFVEADVTNMVNWRESNKKTFEEKFGEKITYTPIFVEAVVQAIQEFPMVNVSVSGKNIILKKQINIGMAVAQPSGTLIVPVIHHADQYNMVGLTRVVNDLAKRARYNELKPDEIQGGTFTLTNVGTFGNVMGTPIINQPQAAILAAGAIRKKPAVLETEYGDVIAVRHMMYLSLSYDHRVVDGMLGGTFLRKIADILEGFDTKRSII